MTHLLKKPSAWVPLLMSLAALTLVVGYVLLYGVTEPQEDEGTAARIFQLLLAGQLPVMAFFTLHWLSKMPRQTLAVLGIQGVAILIALALVFIFEL